MSTKIYEGFRLSAGTDVFGFVQKLRPLLYETFRDSAIHYLASEAVNIHDLKALSSGTKVEDAVSGEYATIPACKIEDPIAHALKIVRIYTSGRRKDVDAKDFSKDFNGTVMFYWHEPTARLYGIPFFGYQVRERAMQVLSGLPEYEEFGYWNNSDDYPKGVTSADWEVRAEIWNGIFADHNAIASEAGLSMTVTSPEYTALHRVHKSDIVDHLLAGGVADENRIRSVALSMASQQMVEERDDHGIRMDVSDILEKVHSKAKELKDEGITLPPLDALAA